MAAEEDRGVKFFFRVVVDATPRLICPPASRLHCVIQNEGPSPIRIGTPSGTLPNLGFLMPSGAVLYDYFSDDDWWGVVASGSSGTVSGFLVEGL